MAETNTKKNASVPTASRGRGRPAKDSAEARDPVDVAKGNLQYALDRACGFINDGSTGVSARAAQCARRGIPQETVEKAVQAMRDALADCEEAIERAYAAPQEKAKPAQRVVL